MRPVTPYSDPIAGPVPRSAAARALWRLKHRVRALLGIRRGFKVDGFYYKETSTELLSRALSRKGSGEKEYRVTFPDGSKLLIHCSTRRPFADILGPVVLPHYQRAHAMIRPGMRVVSLPCGTGNAVQWLAERVGPSGAVVAVDPDAESIAYAQRRYARPNVAFENAGISALAGEIEGSFDAGFIVLPDAPDIGAELLTELWRVIAPGGWLLVGCPAEGQGRGRAGLDELVRLLPATPGPEADAAPAPPRVDWLSTGDDPFHVVIVRKLDAS